MKVKKKTIQTGRPTKYNKTTILKKVRAYLKKSQPEVVQRVKSQGQHSVSYEYVTIPNLPTTNGLSLHLGISRSTLYEWRRKYKEFADLIEELIFQQEETLVCYGLSGQFNATITKLILSARHEYQEKKDHRVETASDIFGDNDDDFEE